MIRYLSGASASNLKGTALLRLDFNTEDNWRMEAAVPTIRQLLKHAHSIVILSHRGRPQAKLKNSEPAGGNAVKFSLREDAAYLSEILKKDVIFVPHFRFPEIKAAVAAAPRGSIFLLENMRFLPGEESNDASLGRELASLGDYFVNDAFAVSHRSNSSLVAITKHIPAFAGLLLQKEISSLEGLLKKPSHPFIAVIGGGKAHDKLDVLRNFKSKADMFLLGGAPANTLLALRGTEVGDSLADDDPEDIRALAPFAKSNKVLVPVDLRKERGRILDIGPLTSREYARILSGARTILWAGPMGYIEDAQFAEGSLAVAKAVASNRKAFSITGGGETVAFLRKHGLQKKFSFISTGGGAMLEFLAGRKLPGITALEESRIAKFRKVFTKIRR